ncbi:MAG: phosphatase PAP2 family protein [Actinobacteria bacterium]|nr:phosphatase PAP2 family protein [Actinomycetota bacterium]
MTPGQYLGLHLTLGLLVAAGCLWLFGGLAEDLVTNDPLVRFDQAVANTLHDLATPSFTAFFLVVTALGSVETLTLLGLLVAAFFAWRRRWIDLGSWVAAVAGAAVLNQLLKEVFARPRPYFEQPLVLETSYSFPSGHSMDSLVLYGMLAYFCVLALRTWRGRTAVVFGVALLVLLIGFSRMYLGVHYFSDVAAGFAAGGVWLSALITGTETIRRGGIAVRPRRNLRAFLRSPAGLWLKRRLSPRGAYGLHLTVGLVLAGLCAWGFAGTVEDVLTLDPLVEIDESILHYIYANPVPNLTLATTVLVSVLSPEVLLLTAALAGLVMVVLSRRGRRRGLHLHFAGIVLLVSSLGTGAIAELSKALFHRDRPPASLQLMPETGHGFPSSHAMAVVVIGAVVWYLFAIYRRGDGVRSTWRVRAVLGLVVVLVALLVGVGRAYTGAHYPSDVLAGWALGGVWASICVTAAEVFRRLREGGSRGSNGTASTPKRPRQTEHPQDDSKSQYRLPWWRRLFGVGSSWSAPRTSPRP